MKVARVSVPACLMFGFAAAVGGCALPLEDAEGDVSEVASQTAALATACGQSVIDDVREHASDGNEEVVVNCNLTLVPGEIITKRLIVEGAEGSGVTIDCNGAWIDSRAPTPALSDENSRRDMILVR